MVVKLLTFQKTYSMIKNSLMMMFLAVILFSCSSTKNTKSVSKLDGSWELNYIMGAPGVAAMFKDVVPTLTVNSAENQVSGNNGCNSYSGIVKIEGTKIDLSSPMAVTRKMCINGVEGEKLYMATLQKINRYSVSEEGKTLTMISGDMALMRFTKK